MLARPEPGSREHILLWLADKNPKETYVWHYYAGCACGQYAREALGKSNLWWVMQCVTMPSTPLSELNYMASFCKTFGELHERAYRRWTGHDLGRLQAHDAKEDVAA